MQHGAALPWLLNGCRSVAIVDVAVEIVVVVEFVIIVHPAALGLVLLFAWVSPPGLIVVRVEPLVATIILIIVVVVELAKLPGGELVAGHPVVIGPVGIETWGVPPTAVIRAVV